MEQYISKAALVAEIERLENDEFLCDSYDEATGFQSALRMVQEFINTLEVKEVDLEKEFDKCCENHIFDDECEVYTARKFFELGFKAKGG